jgi:hypothetical protein
MRRLGREVRALHTLAEEVVRMRCDICDEEFANSEEVKMHKERVHPIDERKDEELESPDKMDAGPNGEPVQPEPVVRPVR